MNSNETNMEIDNNNISIRKRSREKKKLNELYVVYIRSMTTYDDHDLKHLQLKPKLRIFASLSFHKTFEHAKEWLFNCGHEITEQFRKEYSQPCIFEILRETDYIKGKSYVADYIWEKDLHMTHCNEDCPLYVFDASSYKMALDEHKIFQSHDWSADVCTWVHYVKRNGTIKISNCPYNEEDSEEY